MAISSTSVSRQPSTGPGNGIPTSRTTIPRRKAGLKWSAVLRGMVLPVVVILVWQVVCSRGLVPQTILPSPEQIIQAFGTDLSNGQLLVDIQISLWRAAMGFALGGILGLVAGVIAGFSKLFEEVVDPTVQMLRTIPHLAVTPLFILWFGLGEWSKILLIAFGAFFPLYLNTYAGIRGVDRKLFEVALTLRFSKWKQLTRLILPAALPNILVGLRLSIGISWLGLVVAELMGANAGVGYLIEDASQFSQTAYVFVGIVIFAVVGKLSDSLVRLLERRLLRWRENLIQ